jgi:hypothetical protein
MVHKFGKSHLLDDPEMQKLMLGNRSISDKYHFRDGVIFGYTGEYEREFLEYMDLALEWPSVDLTGPSPFAMPYEYEGKQVFYMPDFYIPSLDLIIEIKGTNAHYQEREKGKELVKDKVAASSGHNYLKILDRNYDEFLEGLIERRWNIAPSKEKQITVNEAALISCDPRTTLQEMDKAEELVLLESCEEDWK